MYFGVRCFEGLILLYQVAAFVLSSFCFVFLQSFVGFACSNFRVLTF